MQFQNSVYKASSSRRARFLLTIAFILCCRIYFLVLFFTPSSLQKSISEKTIFVRRNAAIVVDFQAIHNISTYRYLIADILLLGKKSIPLSSDLTVLPTGSKLYMQASFERFLNQYIHTVKLFCDDKPNLILPGEIRHPRRIIVNILAKTHFQTTVEQCWRGVVSFHRQCVTG